MNAMIKIPYEQMSNSQKNKVVEAVNKNGGMKEIAKRVYALNQFSTVDKMRIINCKHLLAVDDMQKLAEYLTCLEEHEKMTSSAETEKYSINSIDQKYKICKEKK